MITREEIEKIQKQIKDDQTEKIRAEERIKTSYEILKKDYGINSMDELEKELDKLEAKRTELNKQIEVDGDKLKKAYEWDL